jgi:hypothetical protein
MKHPRSPRSDRFSAAVNSQVTDYLQTQQVNDLMEGPLRDVFLKYGVEKTFSLCLQHRHHELRDSEVIVRVNGTAHLMDKNEMDDIVSMSNSIVPTTWLMEFAVVPKS